MAPTMHNAFRVTSNNELFTLPGSSLCRLCGTPTEGHQYCYVCRYDILGSKLRSDLPDRYAFLTYAITGEQSGQDAYQYKDIGGAALDRLKLLLYFFVNYHSGCLRLSTGASVSHIAVVPSGRGRKDHPLETELLPLFPSTLERVAVTRVAAARNGGRQMLIDPSINHIDSDVTGRHVLVLEDTWTRGFSALSLATSLKQAGASQVSVLTIARYLNTHHPPTEAWLKTNSPLLSYDPTFCPITRSPECPDGN
ncbi:phosphoribosyltransferase [Dietzia sp. NPDC055340]